MTLVDEGVRELSEQTISAFWQSVMHAGPMSVGVNGSLGATHVRPCLVELGRISDALISTSPNAGLPNALGSYDETPEQTGALLRQLAEGGLVNFVGGCCGTSPAHIAVIAASVDGVPPRCVPLSPSTDRA